MLGNSILRTQTLQFTHGSQVAYPRVHTSLRAKVRVSCIRPDDVGTKDWESLMTANWRPTSLFASDYDSRAFESVKQALTEDGKPSLLTVYSVRMETSSRPGSAMRALSAVNVLLVSADGRSILHRISPVRDPVEEAKTMENICNAVAHIGDTSVGANCLVINAMQRADQSSRSPVQRFQEGAVDEVSFLAPELGPLAGILIGLESGTWVVNEVHVSSSRTRAVCRFVSTKMLGGTRTQGAAWLTPIPQDAVVYGSGDDSIIINANAVDKAHTTCMMGPMDRDLNDYVKLKHTLVLSAVVLSAGGTALAHVLGGAQAAWPFATGGLIGLTYLWLLQQGVDELDLSPPDASESQDLWGTLSSEPIAPKASAESSSSGVVMALTSSPVWRLSVVAAAAYLAVAVAFHQEARQACEHLGCAVTVVPAGQTYSALVKFAIGVLGFMTYKVALVGTALSPVSPPVLNPQTASQGSEANYMERL